MGRGLYLLDHLEAETFVEGVVADIGALQIRGSLDLIDLMFEECGADPPAGNSGADGREIPVRVRRADGRGGARQRNTRARPSRIPPSSGGMARSLCAAGGSQLGGSQCAAPTATPSS